MTHLLCVRAGRAGLLFSALVAAAACTSEDGEGPSGLGWSDGAVLPGASSGNDAAPPANGGGDGGAPMANPPANQPGKDGSVSAPDATAPLGGDASVSDASALDAAAGDGSAPSSTGGGLPCNVKKIVDAKCAATCHNDPPQGAWMSLKTQAHFQAQGTSDKTKKYFELAKIRVGNDSMPPAGSTTLTPDEKATLTAWLNQGAPASTETCAATPDAGVPTDPSVVDTTGLECYQFLAHAPGDKKAKFKVGMVKDAYWNFGFKAPWTGMAYGLVVKPVIDNAKVLHHWLIYREDIADGTVEKTIGQHSGGELIHGWAPGGIAMDFRKHGDVAFELPATSYAVEFHYNSADANATDASGVELCIKKTPPKNIASMSWLGYDHGGVLSYAAGICNSPSAKWTGTCAPQAKEPINLVFMSPHLHQAGRHLKAVIRGVDGKERVLHDKAFDFNYQVTYETKEVLMPGEKIITTCTYSEPKCAGQATTQEMCYLFTYAWPKKLLIDNGSQGKLMHGEGTCLGQ